MPAKNADILRLREDLRRLRSLRFSTDSYADLRDKLAIITLGASFKECFQEFGDNAYMIDEHTEDFKRMGFKVKVTGLPPPYFHSIPKVPSWFLKEYMLVSNVERQNEHCVWLYVKNNVESKILSSLSGELDEGYLLGYPDCCIKWYEDMWRKSVEVLYHYILRRYTLKDRYEVTEAFKHSKARFFTHLFVQMFTDVNLEKTVRIFPFVFHIACEKCLRNSKSPTASINNRNEHLALNLNNDFCKRIEYASSEYVETVKQRRLRQNNEFLILKKRFPWLSKLLEIANLDPF